MRSDWFRARRCGTADCWEYKHVGSVAANSHLKLRQFQPSFQNLGCLSSNQKTIFFYWLCAKMKNGALKYVLPAVLILYSKFLYYQLRVKSDEDTNKFLFFILKGCKSAIAEGKCQFLYILNVLASHHTDHRPSCFSLIGCTVVFSGFTSTSTGSAERGSHPRLLPLSRQCAGRVCLRSSKYWWPTSYYWQSGSKWESTVFCCGGRDTSTCLPFYLTCGTKLVSVRIHSFSGRSVVRNYRICNGEWVILKEAPHSASLQM